MTDIDFQKAIDDYIAAHTAERETDPSDAEGNGVIRFRASELSGCVRQCTRNRMGLNIISKSGLRKMEIGTQLHKFLQRKVGMGYLERPVEFEKSVHLSLEYRHGPPDLHQDIMISGHIDCWDGAVVYDFKTTADIEKTLSYPINRAYIYQLSLYAQALGAKRAVIVYIDKRDLTIVQKDITILTKEAISAFCMMVIVAVREYKLTGELPDLDSCVGCRFEGEHD